MTKTTLPLILADDNIQHGVNKKILKRNNSSPYVTESSNGLSNYEPDNEKVTELYWQFHKTLKPGEKLVTSFITIPPTLTNQCEWNMSKVNLDNFLLQKTIFTDIIGAKWQCYRSSEQTKAQLESVGFHDIQFIYDEAKIFPTVLAFKK